METVPPPVMCLKDGTLLHEDSDFAHDAKHEGIDVHRLVCFYGHSVYYPPVEARGWRPRPGRERRCDQCGVVLTGVVKRSHGQGHRRCRSCRGLPVSCAGCGGAMGNAEEGKTCSDACRAAVIAEAGRRTLATLHGQ